MSKTLRSALAVLVLLFVACTAYAVSFSEPGDSDIPQIVPVEAFIRDWMALGPFPQDPAGQDTNFIPACWKSDVIKVDQLKSITGELNGAKWQKISAADGKMKLDFNALYGEMDDQVAYAAVYVFADKAGKRELLLGSDDGIVVWVNGEKAFEHFIRRGCDSDSDKTTVDLRKGRNLMVVKVTQAILGWEFVARFDNNKGLRVSTSPDSATAAKLLGTDDIDVAPKLAFSPYIQNVTKDGVTLLWQSDVPSAATLTISDGKGEWTYATSKAARLSEVRIDGLQPDTQYSYSLKLASERGTPGDVLAADSWHFKTFPVRPRPIKFVVYGDTRSNPDRHAEVIDGMAKEQDVDFILHVGDLVGDGNNLKLWIPEFFNPAAKLMSHVPMYPCLGNHEGDSPYYYKYMKFPTQNRWYSFSLPGVHVTVLDSNSDFGPGSAQYKWLVEDLEKSRDKGWKFVLLHDPPYTSSNHGRVDENGVPVEKGIRTAQEIFPDLAKKYGIVAIFAGHDHVYERSTRDGVHYIVEGGGGAPTYSKPNAKANPYSKSFYAGLSYVVVDVDGPRVELTAKTPDGKVLDKVDVK